jgi:transcriptional regulator with XRE-family HTH domain
MKDEELNLAIGKRLRSVRLNIGVTQTELGNHLGVSFQQIQKYENGTNRISVAIMLRICAFLQVDPGWFVSGIETSEQAEMHDGAGIAADVQKISDERIRRNLAFLVRSLAEQQ